MWVLLFVLVLLIICVYLFVLAYSLVHTFLHPRRSGRQAKRLPGGQAFSCTTTDGCSLQMYCYKTSFPSNRAVILVPDGGKGAASMSREVKWFLSKGYHVICSDNNRRPVSLGYKERKDLRLILTMSQRMLGEGCRIGTYGVGTGAVTALLHACIDDRVEFVIADSAWSDLETLLSGRLLKGGYPAFPVLQAADLLCRLFVGFTLEAISPEKAMKGRNGLVSIPVLFIAGEKESWIPAAMSQRLYEQKQGAKVLYLCAEGERGRNWSRDPVQYELQMDAFLKENTQMKMAAI